MPHIPVLLNEVLEYSKAADADEIIDGTVGGGGYVREILKVNPAVRILGIDLDQASLDKLSMQLARESLSQKAVMVQGNFRDIKHIANSHSFRNVSAVILDLGFSSNQLDDPVRGLSFQANGPLDMRFDLSNPKTAAEIIKKYPPEKLAGIFRDYGEEKFSYKIAQEIVKYRKSGKIEDTHTLFEIIKESLPKPVKHKAADSARRIFQALRIEVNDELNNLRKALPDIVEILRPGGRTAVISFHSLEDRIVKEFFSFEAKDCICPPEFPTCICGKNPKLKILTKKPITATDKELLANPRSKPAKMRVAEKTNN